MISNWFYYCFTLLTTAFILSSCLGSNSDNMDYTLSRDAQITSLQMSSSEDSLKVLSKVTFSIDQVSSVPLIFNKDSLPYLFDVSTVSLRVETKGASGIRLTLFNPDSTYIWNMKDSVDIKKLKHIEVFAQDGSTTKKYSFKLNTHQQDPDTIFWHNVENNYISQPTDQVTVSNGNQFFTYSKLGNSIQLSTSSTEDGKNWTNQQINGLPQNVLFKSIQNDVFDGSRMWYALDDANNVYESANGSNWSVLTTTLPVKTIYGRFPSFTKDSILTVVKDGDLYKFAKTKDFSSFHVLNNVPDGFPIKDYTSATINDSLIYTAKYLIVTGGEDADLHTNKSVWLLQEDGNKITYTSQSQKFNVTGSSLFNYDNKLYLLTSENNMNVFYTSSNYGVFWEKASNKQSLPADYTVRVNQSVNVDNKNTVWIFGGTNLSQVQLIQVWKGRINKLYTN